MTPAHKTWWNAVGRWGLTPSHPNLSLTEQIALKVPVHNYLVCVDEQGVFVLSRDPPHSTSFSKQSSGGRSLLMLPPYNPQAALTVITSSLESTLQQHLWVAQRCFYFPYFPLGHTDHCNVVFGIHTITASLGCSETAWKHYHSLTPYHLQWLTMVFSFYATISHFICLWSLSIPTSFLHFAYFRWGAFSQDTTSTMAWPSSVCVRPSSSILLRPNNLLSSASSVCVRATLLS
jgi:hypothetical protein